MIPQFVFLFASFFASCNAQFFIDFKNLPTKNGSLIYNGTASIYVTATSDDDWDTKKVFFSSTTSGVKSVYEISQQREPGSDLMTPWIVSGEITIYTLIPEQIGGLTGYVYFTTEAQSKQKNFIVYDIQQNQQVKIDSATYGDYTVVFLNSKYTGDLSSATTFSGWDQDVKTSVFMYPGFPSDLPEADYTQVFSNPVEVSGTNVSIPNVNDFSITLRSFYMKVRGAAVFKFNTSSKWIDVYNQVMNGYTSTGLTMKSYSDDERSEVLIPDINPIYYAMTGFNVVAHIPDKANINITYDSKDPGITVTNSKKMQVFQFPTIGYRITITPKKTNGGQYFIQYYTIQEIEIPITTLGTTITTETTTTTKTTTTAESTTTTEKIDTTTKSSGSTLPILAFMMILWSFQF